MEEYWKNLSKENLPGEKWKPVVGYEGSYEVSNLGRVKSIYREVLKNDRGTWINHIVRPKILKQRLSNCGYLEVCLSVKGKGVYHLSHRLIAKAFVENLGSKKTVNHKNGIKTDNLLSNLEWSTHSENVSHAYQTGLAKIQESYIRGVASPNSKLLIEHVEEIRRLYREGVSIKKLSEIYPLSRVNILRVAKGITYKDVPMQESV